METDFAKTEKPVFRSKTLLLTELEYYSVDKWDLCVFSDFDEGLSILSTIMLDVAYSDKNMDWRSRFQIALHLLKCKRCSRVFSSRNKIVLPEVLKYIRRMFSVVYSPVYAMQFKSFEQRYSANYAVWLFVLGAMLKLNSKLVGPTAAQFIDASHHTGSGLIKPILNFRKIEVQNPSLYQKDFGQIKETLASVGLYLGGSRVKSNPFYITMLVYVMGFSFKIYAATKFHYGLNQGNYEVGRSLRGLDLNFPTVPYEFCVRMNGMPQTKMALMWPMKPVLHAEKGICLGCKKDAKVVIFGYTNFKMCGYCVRLVGIIRQLQLANDEGILNFVRLNGKGVLGSKTMEAIVRRKCAMVGNKIYASKQAAEVELRVTEGMTIALNIYPESIKLVNRTIKKIKHNLIILDPDWTFYGNGFPAKLLYFERYGKDLENMKNVKEQLISLELYANDAYSLIKKAVKA